MKTLLQRCADVETALNTCKDLEGSALYKRERAHEDFLSAAHALADAHAEIQALIDATRSPKNALRFTLRPMVPPGGLLLIRGEICWLRDNGPGAPLTELPYFLGHKSVEELAEAFHYELLASYCHAAIVRPR